MKSFFASLVIIAGVASADGHEDWRNSTSTNGEHDMHEDMMKNGTMSGHHYHDGERMQKALEMIEMFCGQHEHVDDHGSWNNTNHFNDTMSGMDGMDGMGGMDGMEGMDKDWHEGMDKMEGDWNHTMHMNETMHHDRYRFNSDEHEKNHWLCNQALDIYHALTDHDFPENIDPNDVDQVRIAKATRLARIVGDALEMFVEGAVTIAGSAVMGSAVALYLF